MLANYMASFCAHGHEVCRVCSLGAAALLQLRCEEVEGCPARLKLSELEEGDELVSQYSTAEHWHCRIWQHPMRFERLLTGQISPQRSAPASSSQSCCRQTPAAHCTVALDWSYTLRGEVPEHPFTFHSALIALLPLMYVVCHECRWASLQTYGCGTGPLWMSWQMSKGG